MKVSKLILYGLLLISLFLPYIVVAYAAEKPRYVGFNEGQEIIWFTEFDKDPLKDFYEDKFPGWSELDIDTAVNNFFDLLDWDDDVVAWRFYIEEIKKESDKDYVADNSVRFNKDDVNYVKFLVNMYETEDLADPEGWDDFDKLDSNRLWDSEDEVYADILITGLTILAPQMPYGFGLIRFFIPNNLDFGDVIDEVEEFMEIYNLEDQWSVGSAKTAFFFTQKEVGIETSVESTNPSVEDFDSCAKFTNDGILYYYEWEYDGDTIAKYELSQWGFSAVYIIENWWWMALIAGAVIVGLIVLICVIVIKKRK